MKTHCHLSPGCCILGFYLLLLMSSCRSDAGNRLEEALIFADRNRVELEKVLDYYKNDTLKLKAAIYLIENMPGHYAYAGSDMDSLYTAIAQYADSSVYEKQFEYLKQFPYRRLTKQYDSKVITAEYLIENIDFSFKVWAETPWGKYLSFDDFCEYLLPYRLKNEPLTLWKKELYDKFHPVLDSLYQGTDVVVACMYLNKYLNKLGWHYLNDFNSPALPATYLAKHRVGDCYDIAEFVLYGLRAVGIPVAADTYISSPVLQLPHAWNALLDTTGRVIPFENARFFGRDNKLETRIGKAYRFGYALQTNRLEKAVIEGKYGLTLSNYFLKDVSSSYFPSNQITIDCELITDKKKRPVWLGVFSRRGWIPMAEGDFENGKACFQDVEAGLVYAPLYENKGRLIEAGYPFKIDAGSGTVVYYCPDTAHAVSMTLTRKWPLSPYTKIYIERMFYGKFEGANRKDFGDAELLYRITDPPELMLNMMNVVNISNPKSFRYVRYVSSDCYSGDIAELAWYSDSIGGRQLQGNPLSSPAYQNSKETDGGKAFDNNPLTFFTSSSFPGWIGLDLGSPQPIKRITYTPRNDDNFIRIGDHYELYYFSGHGWMSLGHNMAQDVKLVYKSVPANAIFWLRNLTRGKEEQIFSYYNGKQMFNIDN